MTSEPLPGMASSEAPDALISQALSARVGGPRRATGDDLGRDGDALPRRRLTAAQYLLVVAIVGLVLGMGAGFVVILI